MKKRAYTNQERMEIENLKNLLGTLVKRRKDLEFNYDVFMRYWTVYCNNIPTIVEIEQAQRILEYLKDRIYITLNRIKEVELELKNKYNYYDF